MERVALRSAPLRTLRSKWTRTLPLRRYESSSIILSNDGSTINKPHFHVFRHVNELRSVRRQLLIRGETVGFVPTMGALHDGHLSLIRTALRENHHVFVSIFVNPTQFAIHEDLDSYPMTWEDDLAKLKKVEDEHLQNVKDTNNWNPSTIRGIFAPTVKTMYPTLPPTSDIAGQGSFVTITPLGSELEGASRPIFFRGVATVCTKLFNIVQPERVYFGQKDIQQSVLIKRMVRDFLIPTQVRVVPTVREASGLAMSSRNVYLGDRRREDVSVLSRALFAARDLYHSGVMQVGRLRNAAFDTFLEDAKKARSDGRVGPSCRLDVDYIAMSGADTMATIKDDEELNPSVGAILSAAMIVSPVDNPKTQEELNQRSVRLIDNVILEPKVDEKTRRERRQQAATRNGMTKQASEERASTLTANQETMQTNTPKQRTFRKIRPIPKMTELLRFHQAQGSIIQSPPAAKKGLDPVLEEEDINSPPSAESWWSESETQTVPMAEESK
ncbi:pantoate-beta-alanine ligase [Cladophialophora chaetospira]|uniref:Pantoate--beta-alanine ligase n=1 Tax=Cladophialophora chaetospira TaxID=386627 RepID=A0AA39CDK7_9EURO|nr:pantoate-beta-alanine ligase [Cladophialophora chaetospira]